VATYVIGDIHGCFESLQALLATIEFDSRRDRLWLVGDLVARGPRSLEVLRWAVRHDECVTAVLGNHDVHLLAMSAGVRAPKARDRVEAVLEAPDSDELLGWLAKRPLAHREDDYLMVHAGVLPAWRAKDVASLAKSGRRHLKKRRPDFLASLYEVTEPFQATGLPEDDAERARLAISVLTRLRVCTSDGTMMLRFGRPPGEAPEGFRPWFSHGERSTSGLKVLFGHWAALGYYEGHGCLGLDSGCVWGGALTAYRLDDGRRFSQPALEGAG